MRGEPERVIFDCDGVLVDRETISNRVLAEMLTAEGLPTTLAQSRHDYQGMLLAEIRCRAEEKLGRELPENWLARYASERDAVFRRYTRCRRERDEKVRSSPSTSTSGAPSSRSPTS